MSEIKAFMKIKRLPLQLFQKRISVKILKFSIIAITPEIRVEAYDYLLEHIHYHNFARRSHLERLFYQTILKIVMPHEITASIEVVLQ